MKSVSTVLVLTLATALLSAGDFQWVRRCYSWRSNGLMQTATVPVYGDEAVIRCSSPVKGAVKVTVLDESLPENSRRAPRTIVETQHLRMPSSTTVRNLGQMSLLIESQGECLVEVDQYVDSIGEWKLRNWLQRRNSLTPKKLAVWAGDASQKFGYQPKLPCSRVVFTQRGEGSVEVTGTDAEGKVLLRRYLAAAGAQAATWIHTTSQVTFDVQASSGTAWMLEITGE